MRENRTYGSVRGGQSNLIPSTRLTAAMPLRVVEGAIWTSPAGLRVDGPLGRRFLRGLSLTRLWREGCCRAPLHYRRRPFMIKPLQPPCGRRKCIPLWWLAPPPCPVGSMSLDSQSPTAPYESSSFATPASGGTIKLRYALSCL